jgi:excisionase family DNA binding protein
MRASKFMKEMHGANGSETQHSGREQGIGMDRTKEVMTLREASQYLGISPDTLYKYLNENRISGVAFKLGNRWRFKKDLLDRWMEQKSEHVWEMKPGRVSKATGKG